MATFVELTGRDGGRHVVNLDLATAMWPIPGGAELVLPTGQLDTFGIGRLDVVHAPADIIEAQAQALADDGRRGVAPGAGDLPFVDLHFDRVGPTAVNLDRVSMMRATADGTDLLVLGSEFEQPGVHWGHVRESVPEIMALRATSLSASRPQPEVDAAVSGTPGHASFVPLTGPSGQPVHVNLGLASFMDPGRQGTTELTLPLGTTQPGGVGSLAVNGSVDDVMTSQAEAHASMARRVAQLMGSRASPVVTDGAGWPAFIELNFGMRGRPRWINPDRISVTESRWRGRSDLLIVGSSEGAISGIAEDHVRQSVEEIADLQAASQADMAARVARVSGGQVVAAPDGSFRPTFVDVRDRVGRRSEVNLRLVTFARSTPGTTDLLVPYGTKGTYSGMGELRTREPWQSIRQRYGAAQVWMTKRAADLGGGVHFGGR